MRWKTVLGLGALGVAGSTALAGVGLGFAGYGLYRRLRSGESLHGKTALITGGSRGLGLVLAHEFARHGARLVICARDQAELQRAEASLVSQGGQVLSISCDVTVQEEVQSMVAQATGRFGAIDILINNAGVIAVGSLESQTITDFQEAMDVMFWGTVYPTLAVLPQMKRRGQGHIANITSIGGKVSIPHLLPYCSAKFAAVGFSEGLRAELAKSGVKVTTVVPGLMRTGSHINAYFKGNNQQEYTWFSMGATLPLVSMDARRAARRIVAAVRRGQAEVILTPQAKALALAHGVAPGLTADLLGLVNRVLPEAGDASTRHLGRNSETALTRSFLTKLGQDAAQDFNQQSPSGAAGDPGTIAALA